MGLIYIYAVKVDIMLASSSFPTQIMDFIFIDKAKKKRYPPALPPR